MPSALLREYVDLIVEKIRSKTDMGQKFQLPRFKSLENVHMMNAYADRFLSKLGQGSSRAAYQLSNRYVLKIAINEKGVAQNEAEQDVYTNPKTKAITSKVHAADDKHRWLVTDSVREFSDEKEFQAATGIEWKVFEQAIKAAGGGKEVNVKNDFLSSVLSTMRSNKMGPGDLRKLDHWGKTADGRVVLLDYGYTEDVWDKHYSTSSQDKNVDQNAQTRKPGQTQDRDAATAPAKKKPMPADAATRKDKKDPDQDREAPTKVA